MSVPTIASTAQAANQAILCQERLIVSAGVLRTPVRMHNEIRSGITLDDRPHAAKGARIHGAARCGGGTSCVSGMPCQLGFAAYEALAGEHRKGELDERCG